MSVMPSEMDGIEMVILPPVRDLGDGFQVRRALPSAKRRMVGPFIFFDQMGPTLFDTGEGLDVRPHPHIGLATVTYLLEGEILHRDSVGSVQPIRPGAVNWMTAGSGIVHSERTAPDMRAAGGPLFGLQTWVALPTALEESAPSFIHHPADALPLIEEEGRSIKLIAGTMLGQASPVKTASDMIYADVALDHGARFRVETDHIERALYVISGAIEVEGQTGAFEMNQLVVLKPGAEILLRARGATRLMLVGGEPLPEKRHIYWNFVSSSADRIEQAKEDWRARRFADVPGETEFIPLPEEPKPVRYP
ncbi:hypothetical protein CLG96_12630 [Sphingomonas oleivorans]|uniref:Pirin n=1 Tax=Sphingomonas oleivorans TaxID=1735121 RepID=A0A2T5FX21_9SPHN|nr:pirin family protein [Sphingomonas oleivorans]PTQ10309.1 hypothetical protein CLG96_12630 [Sphingomonas oleivorans]